MGSNIPTLGNHNISILEIQEAWRRGDPRGDFPAPKRSPRYDLEVWRLIDQLDDFLWDVDETQLAYYSALYEQLTREYYQRLAEEGSP